MENEIKMADELFPELTTSGLQDWPSDYQEQFWRAYPRRVAKIKAMLALNRLRQQRLVEWDKLIDAVNRYAELKRNSEPRWVKHPTTWLNGGCWDDEEMQNRRSFADIAMGR